MIGRPRVAFGQGPPLLAGRGDFAFGLVQLSQQQAVNFARRRSALHQTFENVTRPSASFGAAPLQEHQRFQSLVERLAASSPLRSNKA